MNSGMHYCEKKPHVKSEAKKNICHGNQTNEIKNCKVKKGGNK